MGFGGRVMTRVHWTGLFVVFAILLVSFWVLYCRQPRPVGQTMSPAAPPITVAFTAAGHYHYGDNEIAAVCSSRGDLLYLAEGRLATSPSIAVVPGGCARSVGGMAPSPGK